MNFWHARRHVAGAALCLALTGEIAQAEHPFALIELDGFQLKWGAPRYGTGTIVRYHFVSQATVTRGARNCRHIKPISGLVQPGSLRDEQIVAEFKKAARLWQDAADITFEAAETPENADILIGVQANPRGRAFANVQYDTRSTGSALNASERAVVKRRIARPKLKSLTRSIICLNPEEHWKIGFDGDLSAYDLKYTFAHELGHAIGIDHPSPSGTLMSFRYTEEFDELRASDIAAVQTLYGTPNRTKAAFPAN